MRVYDAAREAAMRVFQLTKSFPRDERYALTSQIRRSSRSVCANLAEGWQKRRYPAAFRAKLADAAGEADETRAWLDFAHRCGFVSQEQARELARDYWNIVGQVIRMASAAESWRIR